MKNPNIIKDLCHEHYCIKIRNKDIVEFLVDNFDYDEHIKPAFEGSIEYDHQYQCDVCDDIVDDSWVGVEDYNDIKEELSYYEERDPSSVGDIVMEYHKLNSNLPIDIIKALGKDEVYRILEGLDWHV